MRMPGLLSLCVAGLLSLGGCGPAPDAEEAKGSVETGRQGILGPYVSFDPNPPSDLLWRSQVSGGLGLWLMNGPTILGSLGLPPISPSLTVQATADFNMPSQTDLVVHGAGPGSEAVMFPISSAWSPAPLTPRPSSDWYVAASGDFNSDGRADLVLHNRVNGAWHYRYMNGTTLLSLSPTVVRPLPWHIVGAADFNLDGRTDLLWRERNTGRNEVWLMNNMATLSIVTLPTLSLAYYVGATADYTLDGNPDIVWHNPSTGNVMLWQLAGTSLISAFTIGTQGTGCPVWFSQSTPPPPAAGCIYLVGPRWAERHGAAANLAGLGAATRPPTPPPSTSTAKPTPLR